jgi:hypothetical protein
MLVFNETTAAFAGRNRPEGAAYWQAWKAYMDEMNAVTLSGQALQPPETASTVRLRGGRRLVEDGPNPDAKEGLGGFCIIEVADLDAALGWAAKAPCARDGSVTVAPVLQMG